MFACMVDPQRHQQGTLCTLFRVTYCGMYDGMCLVSLVGSFHPSHLFNATFECAHKNINGNDKTFDKCY